MPMSESVSIIYVIRYFSQKECDSSPRAMVDLNGTALMSPGWYRQEADGQWATRWFGPFESAKQASVLHG